MERICKHCGNGFNGRTRDKYCSLECSIMGRQTARVIKACVVCGKSFETGGRAGRSDKAFCSWECRYRGRYRRGGASKILTPEQAAYLAGFIDADGSFIIHGRYDGTDSLTFRVQAGGTRPAVFEWFREITGLGTVTKAYRSKGKPEWRDYYNWYITADAAVSLAEQLLPYLVLKKPQAELGIKFQERLREPVLKADRAWQQEYRAEMAEMNHKGQLAP